MTIDDGLGEALSEAAQGQITFPRDFHGFPGTVHGGAVAALFYRLTLPWPPIRLQMDLLRGVPTETPLRLTTGSTGQTARLGLDHGERRLAEATLRREAAAPIDPGPALAAWADHGSPLGEVPGTASCLACGSANPLSLGLRFLISERLLWREYTPHPGYRTRDGAAHPALATIALDELGWWLGALAQGECGVTTEVTITLCRPLPFAPLWIVGSRAAVQTDDDPRGRYCRARGYLLAPGGELLAVGDVRFAGSRAYTRRLLAPFLETTNLETLTRLFPSAGQVGARRGGA